jgi:hypothetical protein
VIFFRLLCISILLSFAFLSAAEIVAHDKAYYKYNKDNIEIIYTEENLPFAQQAVGIQKALHKDYEKFFGWKLDETLYIGLLSSYNQIANGESSQFSGNRQINYIGGTQLIDYFASSSWLNVLCYHETAHNYQQNMKNNGVSKTLHSFFGSGSFLLPFVIVPNIMENSFMLEGNAVLNESWHGNGGRLYSGRFKAETMLQAKAGNIKAGDVYNVKDSFPYSGSIWYIQGGFYNLYLAQKYGLERVNSYFRYHSEDFFWPEFTDLSMKDAVGVDFETSLADFSSEYAKMAEHMVLASGEPIASSQFFYSLGNSEEELFFITNESGVETPELIVLNKRTLNINKRRESWLGGKVIKADKTYYTQGSSYVSPTRIYQGLFDSNSFIKEGSESKMIQGYLSSGKEVYFDVALSYSEAQLFVGSEFYAQVNSSVIIDRDDNLYYFVQNGKKRTLYKNRTPLYTYSGFYGVVSDVDSKGGVYFVANSEFGSTLYRFFEGKVERASEADNIVEARLINDSEVLIAAISEKDYYYVKNELKKIDETPYETKLFFEEREYYGGYEDTNRSEHLELDLSNPYYSLLDINYLGSDLSVVFGDAKPAWALNANFGDPLSQNQGMLLINKDESNTTIAGASYSNSQYLLGYSIVGYRVVESDKKEDVRENGFIISSELPFYRRGHYRGVLGASYYQDYSAKQREPLSATLNFAVEEKYGVSMYENYLNSLSLYGARERDDKIYGAKYSFKHDVIYELYFGVEAKYSATNSDLTESEAIDNSRGVKITNSSYQQDMDPSTIHMPSLDTPYYLKTASYREVNLAKVLNLSSYWFTFPLSLQKEAIYTKYRQYELETFGSAKVTFSEVTAGLTLSTVFLNKFVLPVNFEYITNDAYFIKDKTKFRFMIGSTF